MSPAVGGVTQLVVIVCALFTGGSSSSVGDAFSHTNEAPSVARNVIPVALKAAMSPPADDTARNSLGSVPSAVRSSRRTVI